MNTTDVMKLLTVREVAKRTSLQTFRIYQLLREGRLPAIRVGRTYRISEAALAQFIERESKTP